MTVISDSDADTLVTFDGAAQAALRSVTQFLTEDLRRSPSVSETIMACVMFTALQMPEAAQAIRLLGLCPGELPSGSVDAVLVAHAAMAL